MFKSLSELTAPEATLVAAIIAAVVTAIGAFTVATVNARAARRLAREQALRAFRMRSVQKLLDAVDEQIKLYEDVISLGPHVVTQLKASVAEKDPEERKKTVDTLRQDLAEKIARLANAPLKKLVESDVLALIGSDQRVLDKAVDCLKYQYAVLTKYTGFGKVTANLAEVSEVRRLLEGGRWSTVDLRLAIEEAAFGQRGPLTKALYFLYSKCLENQFWKLRPGSFKG